MSYGGDPRFLLPSKTVVSPPTVDSTPVLVKPQDPSGYGYAHGPSGPKKEEPTIIQPKTPTMETFDTWFPKEQATGATINIYNSSGAKVGSVKADNQGKQVLESYGPDFYFREQSQSTFDSKQQRDFADFIASSGAKGEIIDLFSGNTKVGSVSGPNAYRDTIPYGTKYGSLRAEVEYSTTPEGKSLLDVQSKGGIISFSNKESGSLGLLTTGDTNPKSTLNNIVGKSSNGFSYSIFYPKKEAAIVSSVKQNPALYESILSKNPNFFQAFGEKGFLSESGMNDINYTLRMYEKQQAKPFIAQNKATAEYISGINARKDPSYYFNIKDENGNVVGKTTGQRSYYDFMKANLASKNGVSIEAHFSNTPEAASKREDLLSNSLNQNGIEAYGEDANKPQLGGLQAIPRFLESSIGQYGAGIESAFSHLISGNRKSDTTYPGLGGAPETLASILTNQTSSKEFSKDITHTFLPVSLTGLSQGKIQARGVELTPEASTLVSRTSAPSSLAYLMGKEAKSPSANKEYYDVQSAFLIGSTIVGVKDAIPIVKGGNSLLLQPEKPIFVGLGRDVVKPNPKAASSGFAIGYDWLGYKTLFEKTASGYTIGKASNEKMAPSGYRIVAPEQEGTEVAAKGNAYTIRRSIEPQFHQYLSDTGRYVQPNAGEIMQSLRERHGEVISEGQTNQERPFQAGKTLDETAGSGLITGIQKKQSIKAYTEINTGGRLNEVYGSGLTFAGVTEAGKATLEKFDFGQGDVESKVNSLFFINKQAKGEKITKSIHDTMLEKQGFIYNPETKSYEAPRGPESLPEEKGQEWAKEQLGELKYSIAKSATSRGNYIGGSSSQVLQLGKRGFRKTGDVDIYVKSSKFNILDNVRFNKEVSSQLAIIKEFYRKSGKNPDEVLIEDFGKKSIGTRKHFVRIYDKTSGQSIAEIILRTKPKKGVIKEDKVINFLGINARKANQIIRDKNFIIKELERKKASGKQLTPAQEKKLAKSKSDVAAFRNAETSSTIEMAKSGLLPDYLRTRVLKTKILSFGKTVTGKETAEGGKAFELPNLDKDVISASKEKGGKFHFTSKIDTAIHKYNAITGGKIRGASQIFNRVSNIKKQATANTKESLAQQGGVNQEHLDILGEKAFFGEAVYSGWKGGARSSIFDLDTAMRLIQNSATRERGLRHLKNIDIGGRSQSWFYGVNWNEMKEYYFQQLGLPVPDIIRESSNSYNNYVMKMTGGKPISSFKPSKLAPESKTSGGPPPKSSSFNSSNFGKSITISTSRYSYNSKLPYNEKLAGKSSLIGTSQHSVISGKSNRSSLSSKSTISSKSGISNQSGISNKSGLSGPSGVSGISGISGLSGISGKSGPSGPSGLSGRSGPSGVSAMSGVSGLSGRSGSSGYSRSSGGGYHAYGFPKLGAISPKRKGGRTGGPTTTYLHEVNNIFASSLSIKRIK